MFPIKDSIKSNSFPLVSLALIAINVYVFLKEITAANADIIISNFALVPNTINFSNPSTLLPFITTLFLHGGFIHIISNMWFLWIFGDNVEDTFGKIPFLFL